MTDSRVRHPRFERGLAAWKADVLPVAPMPRMPPAGLEPAAGLRRSPMFAVTPWRRVAPPRVARGPDPCKGPVLLLDDGARIRRARETPDARRGGAAHPSTAPPGTRPKKRRRQSGPARIRIPITRLQGVGAAVAPRARHVRRRSRTCSGLPTQRDSSPLPFRSASRTKKGSRCPLYAPFCFRRHCTKRRVPDLHPRGLAVPPVPPRASRSLGHPPWRWSRFGAVARPLGRPACDGPRFVWSGDVPQQPLWPPSAAHGLLDIYLNVWMEMQPPGVEPGSASAGGSPTRVLGPPPIRPGHGCECARMDSNHRKDSPAAPKAAAIVR